MTEARKKRFHALLALALSALWFMSASRVRAEDVVNGSFEVPALGSNYKFNPTGTGVGWTFVGTSGIQGNGSAWNGANAPDGVQTAVIQNLSSFSQTINFNAGSHTLSLQAARRLYSVPAGSVQPIKVSIDGQQIGNLISPASTSFSQFTIPFSIATSGAHTLSFAGTLGTPGNDVSTFIDEVVITRLPPHITFGPKDISPNSFFYLLGTDFGDQAGTINIHFPKGPSTTDLSVPIGQPSSQWWYPGLTGGTVANSLAGVVEQTVDITITTKDGKKSNVWQAKFHPRMVAAHLPQSRVVVVACSDGAHMNSCNHKGDESGECPFGFATEGIPPIPSDSFGGHHHGCFGISSDNGTDIFSASLKNGWTFESSSFSSTTLNFSNGTASAPQIVPTLTGASSIKMSVNWHIGATGGFVGYEGSLTILGPKGVSF